MNISCLARFFNFDIDTQMLSIRLEFLEPEMQKAIELAVIEEKLTKLHFKLKFRQTALIKHYKVWYGILSKIAKSDQYQLAPFADNMTSLDDHLRTSILPVIIDNISGSEIPRVARLHELSDEQRQKCIEVLQDRYSYLTINNQPIDFTDLKEK